MEPQKLFRLSPLKENQSRFEDARAVVVCTVTNNLQNANKSLTES
jgi:hypothetical protein